MENAVDVDIATYVSKTHCHSICDGLNIPGSEMLGLSLDKLQAMAKTARADRMGNGK